MTPIIARRIMQQRNISQSVAAKEIGISRSTLYRWMREPSLVDASIATRILGWIQRNEGLAMDDRAAWEALDGALLTLLPDPWSRKAVQDLIISLVAK